MPTVIEVPRVHQRQVGRRQQQGIKVGCCRICTCLHIQFLFTQCGLLKIFELLLGSCCETILIRFGMPAASEIGEAFYGMHSTVCCCLTTSAVLVISYIFSQRSFNLIRQSVFEVLFNCVACFLYISSSAYVAYSVNLFYHPRFSPLSTNDASFPAMICIYYLGFIISIVYGFDAFVAYKAYKGYD